jgi:hypothetical protein
MLKRRVRELRRLRNQAFAEVMRRDTQLDLAKAEIVAARQRLKKFLDGLNTIETLWRRIDAREFIAAHHRRIAEAYARKDEAWRMLMQAKEKEAEVYALHAKERLEDLRNTWKFQRAWAFRDVR